MNYLIIKATCPMPQVNKKLLNHHSNLSNASSNKETRREYMNYLIITATCPGLKHDKSKPQSEIAYYKNLDARVTPISPHMISPFIPLLSPSCIVIHINTMTMMTMVGLPSGLKRYNLICPITKYQLCKMQHASTNLTCVLNG